MSDFLSGEHLFWICFAIFCGFIIVAAVVGEHLTARVRSHAELEQARAREETRRELAAYVAEGSLSPEDAAKILNAGTASTEASKSALQECIEASAELSQQLSGREARRRARAAVQGD